MEKYERDIQRMTDLENSFADTCKMSEEDTRLAESVKRSIIGQEIVLETDTIMNIPVPHKDGKVIVSTKSTLEAAAAYKDKHVAVLSFGAAYRPGGGHVGRSNTQEESLCRETTLYSCISTEECMKRFYAPHTWIEESTDSKNNADLIYTPDVTVFKTHDAIPKTMTEFDWFKVDVITMAAPNLSYHTPAGRAAIDDEILKAFETRFERIIKVAMHHGAEVLILGAFGCGEYNNDPTVVATGVARALEKYHEAFDVVEFAIPAGRSKTNYRMFRLILDRYINN